MADATVEGCYFRDSRAEGAAAVVTVGKVGPDVRPGGVVFDDCSVGVHVEGGFEGSSRGSGVEAGNPHRVEERLDDLCRSMLFFLLHDL